MKKPNFLNILTFLTFQLLQFLNFRDFSLDFRYISGLDPQISVG